MSAHNSTIISDPSQLTPGDLLEEYDKLSTAYRQLLRSEERSLQQIYELKRTVQTVSNAETHLTAELEFQASGHAEELLGQQQRHRAELDELKARLAEAQEANTVAESDHDQLRTECAELRKQLEEAKVASQRPQGSAQLQAQAAECLARAEQENEQLMEKLFADREQLSAALKQIVQLERQIDDLRDHLECTECTLQNKRAELEAKCTEAEAAQELIIQMTEELSALRKEPVAADTAKRGNSLFAEVDDQRQHMKLVLAAQKKHYMQMKQECGSSQQVIRSLKRENGAMKKELEICGAMFMNADQTFKDKLNDRIGKLLGEIRHLEKKVQFTENKLLSVAQEQGVSWLDSMLTFCKNESVMYKDQLRQCRVLKATVEEQLNNAELDLARWRFEALKLRCIIIQREQVLEENAIAFEPEPAGIVAQARAMEAHNPRPAMVAPVVEPMAAAKMENDTGVCKQDLVVIEELKQEAKIEIGTGMDAKLEAKPESNEEDKENNTSTKPAHTLPVTSSLKSELNFSMNTRQNSLSPEEKKTDKSPEQAELQSHTIISTASTFATSLPKTRPLTVPNFTAVKERVPASSKVTFTVEPIPMMAPAPIPATTEQPIAAGSAAAAAIRVTTKTAPMMRRIIVKSKAPTLYPQ